MDVEKLTVEAISELVYNIEDDTDADEQFPIKMPEELGQLSEIIDVNKKTISFREIVGLLVNHIRGYVDSSRPVPKYEYFSNLDNVHANAPKEYLFFDYCLSLLQYDIGNAMLYLANTDNILGHLLYKVTRSPVFSIDSDVRILLALLARGIQPLSASVHITKFGDLYLNRFHIYEQELKKLGLSPV